MAKKKRKQVSSSESSSDSSSDESGSGSGSGSETESSQTSQVSPSRQSGRQKDDSPEPDPRERFLLPSFQPKPIRSTVSDFAKKTLRGPFIGQPMGREEHKGLVEEYYCSPNDYEEFSAPTINDSPLSLLHHSNSDAQNDLLRVHNDLLFGVRIGLLHYERSINLCANFAPEEKHPVTGKAIPAGPWASFDYKYKDGTVPCPVPHKIRSEVTQDMIQDLLARDFVAQAGTPEDKLDAICKWAISYRMGYERQQAVMDEIHLMANSYYEALKEINTSTDILRKDGASSLRLFGSACQQIKSIREAKYTESLDGAFKKFLETSKKSKTPKEKMDLKAGPLVAPDLAKKAKDFKKLKSAMDSVAKPHKRKKEHKPSTSKKAKVDVKKGKGKAAAANKAAANRRIKNKGKGKGDKPKPKKDNKSKKESE